MVMSWVFTLLIAASVFCAAFTGEGSALSAAVLEGAQSGVSLAIAIAGSICLWSGVGKLMEHGGLTSQLARLLKPLLNRLFPSTKNDPVLAGALSANLCANILGMGNAATPMGIQAAKRLVHPSRPDTATDELCRLIVLNTASIQLIPSNVAALRASLGSAAPFDILPAVWITSLCSAGLGLCAAWCLGKLWPNA